MLATSEKWFSIEDLAARYGVTVPTVRAWRRRGTAPRGHLLGRHVRFAPDDVKAWESARADRLATAATRRAA